MYRNITLVMPNFNWKVEFDVSNDLPMGLLYIGAVLENKGFKVRIIDANAEKLSMDEVVSKIMECNSHFVAISANYSPLNNLSLELSEKIKKANSKIIVGIGGNHATASYNFMLKISNGYVDFILRGQGELVIPELLDALNNKEELSSVKGIAYIRKGKIVLNSNNEEIYDLDRLPIPAYHLVNMNLYDRYTLVSSRGCPYKCTYCASSVICSCVSYRSPENIVDEIEFLIKKYGKKFFWFSDDTFTSNIKHTNKLLDLIIEKKIEIEWSCLTRVNKTNVDILKKMKDAGCKYVSYGVESGDIGIINKMNKNITLSEVKEALKITKEVGLDMYTFFLIGYPGENHETIKKSFDLIREIKPTGVSFAIVIPLPGTVLWEYLLENNYISYETIEWDYLFAKSGKQKYEKYSAELASSWCGLSKDELILLCNEGQNLN